MPYIYIWYLSLRPTTGGWGLQPLVPSEKISLSVFLSLSLSIYIYIYIYIRKPTYMMTIVNGAYSYDSAYSIFVNDANSRLQRARKGAMQLMLPSKLLLSGLVIQIDVYTVGLLGRPCLPTPLLLFFWIKSKKWWYKENIQVQLRL